MVAASVARHVLIAADKRALERSVEAWVPRLRTDSLADWVPLVGAGYRRN